MQILIIVVAAIALWGSILAFVAWLLELLWNFALVPTLHLPSLGFWTSFALLGILMIIGGALHK